jgi:ribosome recycling factor
MSRALDALERDLAAVRTGRASTASSSASGRVLRHHHAAQPAGQHQRARGAQIVIQPWDRSALGAIEKAILKSDVGLTPNVDGTVVRLNIPP